MRCRPRWRAREAGSRRTSPGRRACEALLAPIKNHERVSGACQVRPSFDGGMPPLFRTVGAPGFDAHFFWFTAPGAGTRLTPDSCRLRRSGVWPTQRTNRSRNRRSDLTESWRPRGFCAVPMTWFSAARGRPRAGHSPRGRPTMRRCETSSTTCNDPEAVVGILKGRRDARSGRAPGDLDVVAPGASA
jgi:hypothetical protein